MDMFELIPISMSEDILDSKSESVLESSFKSESFRFENSLPGFVSAFKSFKFGMLSSRLESYMSLTHIPLVLSLIG